MDRDSPSRSYALSNVSLEISRSIYRITVNITETREIYVFRIRGRATFVFSRGEIPFIRDDIFISCISHAREETYKMEN